MQIRLLRREIFLGLLLEPRFNDKRKLNNKEGKLFWEGKEHNDECQKYTWLNIL